MREGAKAEGVKTKAKICVKLHYKGANMALTPETLARLYNRTMAKGAKHKELKSISETRRLKQGKKFFDKTMQKCQLMYGSTYVEIARKRGIVV